jgi:hypothetical protein
VDKQRVADSGNPSEHGITCEHCGCWYKMPRVAGDLHVAFETEGTRRFVKQQVFECKTKMGGVKCKGFGCHSALTVLHRLPLAVQSRIEIACLPVRLPSMPAWPPACLACPPARLPAYPPACPPDWLPAWHACLREYFNKAHLALPSF